MRRKITHLLSAAIVVAMIVGAPMVAGAEEAKNIIFIIGDGMGFSHIEAARMYKGSALSFELLPYQGQITTYSANSTITDSAAAATALATGVKVNNEVISQAIPGDGSSLETLVEFYRDNGKSTGLVTTTYMTHATPASFGAHESSRDLLTNIASDYLNETRPNILFGGGANGMTSADAVAAGYTVVTDLVSMQGLDTDAETMVSGQFGSTHLPYELDGLGSLPRLAEMSVTALDILDNDPDGFFLMIEGGKIDHAAHANDLARTVGETLGLDDIVSEVLAWASGRTDTLIVVTADHETGGLTVVQDNDPGFLPDVTWSTGGHTGVNVPAFAWGVNADLIFGIMDNTYIHQLAAGLGTLGDANGDGKIDGSDLAIWQQHYDPVANNPLNNWSTGDWNHDGKVDGSDLALWQQNYDPLGAGFGAIPEPSSLILFAMTGSVLVFGYRTRKRR